jgi:capsular exopolysaccharide synthesis family protein
MRPRYRASVSMSRHLELEERRLEPRALGATAVSRQSDGLSMTHAGTTAPAGALDQHLVSLLSPRSFEADQYRVLRHLLEQAREATGLKVLAVTSPAVGDGKTTTAINLAATIGQSPGCRVLLVDADLRRPSVAASLGLDASGPGLVEAVLDDRLELGDVARPTAYNVTVLPAGRLPGDAYQVLESSRVGHLLEQARSSYDYILLDTPPLLLVPDGRLVSQWIDRFLLVVAAHRTPGKLVGETLSAMDQGKVLGIVLNGDDRPLVGYYGKYYGNYYREAPARRGPGGWWRWWRGQGRPRTQPWR